MHAHHQRLLYGHCMKTRFCVLAGVLFITVSGCTKTVQVVPSDALTTTSSVTETPSTEVLTIAPTTEDCCSVFDPTMPTSSTFAPPQNETSIQRNARLMAAQYLDSQAFSRQGLIDQLLYEGFTEEEANIGLANSGL